MIQLCIVREKVRDDDCMMRKRTMGPAIIDMSGHMQIHHCYHPKELSSLSATGINLTDAILRKTIDTREYILYDSIYMRFKNRQD